MGTILNNLSIVLSDHIIKCGHIVIDGKIINKVVDHPYVGSEAAIDCSSLIAMPGFIDVHIHGTNGIDFMDANRDDYKEISYSLFKEGVTTYLATTLTSDYVSLEKVCNTVNEAKKDNPSLLGIHLEGPYISKEKKGAQNDKYIRDPDIKELNNLIKASNNNIRYITVAPELKGAKELIRNAYSHNIVVSAGHTMASFEDIKESLKYGLTNTTHTYNAMTGDDHKHPGVVNAAIYFDTIYPELICDKVHVAPNTLKMFYKAVGPERIIAITDALKVKHTNIKDFQLFGIDCIQKKDAAYTYDNHLAGSILTMDQALRNMYELCDTNLSNLSKITSRNAAKSLHLIDRGDIKEGLLADLVLLDSNLKVYATYKLGELVYINN